MCAAARHAPGWPRSRSGRWSDARSIRPSGRRWCRAPGARSWFRLDQASNSQVRALKLAVMAAGRAFAPRAPPAPRRCAATLAMQSVLTAARHVHARCGRNCHAAHRLVPHGAVVAARHGRRSSARAPRHEAQVQPYAVRRSAERVRRSGERVRRCAEREQQNAGLPSRDAVPHRGALAAQRPRHPSWLRRTRALIRQSD